MERRAKEQWKSNRNATKSLKLIKKYKFLPNFTETCIFHSRRPITGNVMAMKS